MLRELARIPFATLPYYPVSSKHLLFLHRGLDKPPNTLRLSCVRAGRVTMIKSATASKARWKNEAVARQLEPLVRRIFLE